ncbi:hypothetical protein NM688_g1075 [Phlebia brevispora]|uniref:Uncharacterized protein n=1 Tax=Phlebia brevispora TaxID=194682 RepID=A0ACC1TCJ4_9APHY|nr:hypothetical protein NM688_g1075 [Phlebia brevispora]
MDPEWLSQMRPRAARHYLTIASIVLTWYDHLLTFDDELRHVWSRRWSAGTWLFLVIRYFSLSLITSNLTTLMTWNSIEVAAAIIEGVVTIIMFLRVYALHGQDRRILGLGAVAFSGALAACLWIFLGHSQASEIEYGCDFIVSLGIRYATAWEALLGIDIMIFVLTFSKTREALREPRRANLRKFGQHPHILCMYFSYHLTSGLTYRTQPVLKGSLCVVVNSISVTMLSRMMLNIHKSVNRTNCTLSLSDDADFNPTTLDFLGTCVHECVEDGPDISHETAYVHGPTEIEMGAASIWNHVYITTEGSES